MHDKLTYGPFKSFFKLRLADRPHQYQKVVYETYKRSPNVQRANFSFLFVYYRGKKSPANSVLTLGVICTIPGTAIPLQHPLKLALVKVRLGVAMRRLKSAKEETRASGAIRSIVSAANFCEENDILEPETVAYMINLLTIAMQFAAEIVLEGAENVLRRIRN